MRFVKKVKEGLRFIQTEKHYYLYINLGICILSGIELYL